MKRLYDSDRILSRHLRQINIKSALYLRLFSKDALEVRAYARLSGRLIRQIETWAKKLACRLAIDLFKFISTLAEHYSSKKIKTTIY